MSKYSCWKVCFASGSGQLYLYHKPSDREYLLYSDGDLSEGSGSRDMVRGPSTSEFLLTDLGEVHEALLELLNEK